MLTTSFLESICKAESLLALYKEVLLKSKTCLRNLSIPLPYAATLLCNHCRLLHVRRWGNDLGSAAFLMKTGEGLRGKTGGDLLSCLNVQLQKRSFWRFQAQVLWHLIRIIYLLFSVIAVLDGSSVPSTHTWHTYAAREASFLLLERTAQSTLILAFVVRVDRKNSSGPVIRRALP